MILRDELGVTYEDHTFASLFNSRRGRSAESPGCLALVTALQFAEDLTDRQAADAVRGRIDWKYLLGLELTDPGFDSTLLHEFRNGLLENEAEQKLLDELLKVLKCISRRRVTKIVTKNDLKTPENCCGVKPAHWNSVVALSGARQSSCGYGEIASLGSR
jgi:transposase